MIKKYEPTDSKKDYKLTIQGFSKYLTDSEHFVEDKYKLKTVYQNTKKQLPSYFINASHNTYKTMEQIFIYEI